MTDDPVGDTAVGPPDPPAPAAFVDLHAHTTASDGSASPEELVAAARAAGLAAVAVTDHDTIAGVRPAQEAGARAGVRVVAGVELSAVQGTLEVHILGLHLSRAEVLEEALVQFRDTRLRRAEEMVRRLNSIGVMVTLDAVLREAAGGAVGRPHVARAIIGGGWARDNREVFERFLGTGRPAFVPKHRLTAPDAIGLIHDAGGLAIFAHPGPIGTPSRVDALVAAGLDGLEVRHPGHPPEETHRLAALVERLRLVPSGGADWHGAAEGPRRLGSMEVPLEWMERQEARLAARAARERVA